MRVFYSLPPKGTFHNAVITQGTFDGVHLGHKKIIEQLKKIANELAGETVLLTFFPHPRHVLKTHTDSLKLLSTLSEKILLLEKSGLDNLVVVPFDEKFAETDPEYFVNELLLNQLNMKHFVIGYDHKFGKNRRGDYAMLQQIQKEKSFGLSQINAQEMEYITVSSTVIRKSIALGELDTANKLLGHNYIMNAKVVHGNKLGRTIGFPTANLLPEDDNKLIPGMGSYAVWVNFNIKRHKGMLNVGNNPTIPQKGFSIELNIFNFASDIYGLHVEVEFVKKMRSEYKFNDISQLKEQLNRDRENAENILNSL